MNDEKSTSYPGQSPLSAARHRVLREGGTEPPFSSPLIDERRPGDYHCQGCGNRLFSSQQKIQSGCGWPAFSDAEPDAIIYRDDHSHGMSRTEIICAQCQGHLGHVFKDGPAPTGLRYCVNGLALNFTQDR